ncbi:MAG: prolyl aminopeptidase [Proteobacteria bacterium]|nr:prolyl aminopeptidase [Pseudomonadota bacterium]
MKRRDLFPPLEPYQTGRLKVDDIHTLYWEASGNPQGVPVVFLHGGPGAGTQTVHRRFFDPKRWHIILFDQRGAGRSEPHGETRNNTTALLVADMEKLREHLQISRWHLFGGSWGSTLALAYAQTHPQQCLGLILRGICLLEHHEIEWFLYGLRVIFPDAWENFASVVPPEERNNLLEAYIKLMNDPNPDIRSRACAAWSGYESTCSTLLPHPDQGMGDDGRRAIGIARLEAHYFRNNVFEPETALSDNIDKIRSIPAVIVHGRYDMICPVANAWKLHRLWPEAELAIIPDAGHAALEPSIRDRLIEATERFKDIVG